jgi:transcription initiation factor TFIIIB Brf1 subunit/transcription initiation factor TFIIB
VLVCPDCQRVHDWTADLDRCASCNSTQLAKTLGDVVCRSCGAVTEGTPIAPAPATGLAAEVEEAITRVLREPPRG